MLCHCDVSFVGKTFWETDSSLKSNTQLRKKGANQFISVSIYCINKPDETKPCQSKHYREGYTCQLW